MFEFLRNYAHDIMCWSWAIGICGLLFTVMMLVDYAWNVAYQRGFKSGIEYASQVDESLGDREHYYS